VINFKPKEDCGLNELSLLGQLESLAHALGIQVRYECLEGEPAFRTGGLCRIRKKSVIIINSKATPKDKIRTLAEALRRFDLSNVYLKPVLRDFLETRFEQDEDNATDGHFPSVS
jgi:hypothetical protein